MRVTTISNDNKCDMCKKEEKQKLEEVTNSKMDVKVPPPFVFSDIDLSSVKGEIPNYSLYENH